MENELFDIQSSFVTLQCTDPLESTARDNLNYKEILVNDEALPPRTLDDETIIKLPIKDHMSSIEDYVNRLKVTMNGIKNFSKDFRKEMVLVETSGKQEQNEIKDFVIHEISRLDDILGRMKESDREEARSLNQQVDGLVSLKRKVQQSCLVTEHMVKGVTQLKSL